MTTPTVSDFRTRFPPFAADAAFPDAIIQMYLNEAQLEVSQTAFGAHWPLSVMLHAAHNLAIETTANAKAAANPASELSGAVGGVGGLNSASVGDVSVSLNLKAPEDEVWGNLGATLYGQRLMAMMKKMGRGGLVVKSAISDLDGFPAAPTGGVLL